MFALVCAFVSHKLSIILLQSQKNKNSNGDFRFICPWHKKQELLGSNLLPTAASTFTVRHFWY